MIDVKDSKGLIVVDCPHAGTDTSALQTNYIRGIAEASTPFVFCCEHDWTFLREVQIKNIIKCMTENYSVNFIRFNKRDNNFLFSDCPPNLSGHWETYVEEEKNLSGCDLMKTNSIATHPHVIRVSKFQNDWIDIANQPQPGVWGAVEVNLYRRYTLDIERMGFKHAHEKWGIYNYGSKNDARVVMHTDGSLSGRI